MKNHVLQEKKTAGKTKTNQAFFKKKPKKGLAANPQGSKNTPNTPLSSLGANPASQKKSTKKDASILEKISGMGVLELHDLAKEEQVRFEKEGTKAEAALKLTFIFNILQQESNKYSYSISLEEEPKGEDAEIWKIYGGFGSPSMGNLKSISPFRNIEKWKASLSSFGQDIMHEAYLGKRGTKEARLTNYGMKAKDAEIAYKEATNKKLAPIKAGSEWNMEKAGAKNPAAIHNPDFEMTVDQFTAVLSKIYPKGITPGGKSKDFYKFEDHKDILKGHLDKIKKAFKLAKIDTIPSQSAYLAHGTGEMRFAILTEGQTNYFKDEDEEMIFDKNPDGGGPLRYAAPAKHHSKVDPLGELAKFKQKSKKEQTQAAFRAALKKTFIGRGPVQVTHDFGYAKTLFYLQKMAESATDAQTQNELWQAVYDIKKEPSAVGKPEYAFLFSAAYMHATGGIRGTSQNLNKGIPEIAGSQVRRTKDGKKNTGATGQQKSLLDWVAGEENNYLSSDPKSDTMRITNIKIRAYNEFFKMISGIKKRKELEKNAKKKPRFSFFGLPE